MLLKGKQALQFLEDYKAGLGDAELRSKYDLSDRDLRLMKAGARDWIAQKKTPEQAPSLKVDALEILRDLRSGVDDEALMRKYHLTGRQLQRVFRKLIAAGAISALELSGRLSITSSQIREAFEEVERSKSDSEK